MLNFFHQYTITGNIGKTNGCSPKYAFDGMIVVNAVQCIPLLSVMDDQNKGSHVLSFNTRSVNRHISQT